MNKKGQAGFIVLIVVLILAIIIASLSIYTIQAGQRGVILTWGEPSKIAVEEGLHFKIPVAQKVIKMDIKTQKYEIPASAASKDLQVVSAVIAVNYHLVGESVPSLYKEIGLDYQTKIISPAVQEVVKSATAKFTAEQLITQRSFVKDDIEMALRDRLQSRFIQVESISIVNFDFSASFNNAIEQKVTAEQDALKSKNVLEQKKYEAEQILVTAQAQAESIRIQAESINQQGGEDYVNLKSIEKWDGKLPIMVMGNGATPFIDVSKITE